MEFTLLSEGQIWGNDIESQLDIMQKYGKKAAITDLVILTGGYVCENTDYNVLEDKSLSGRVGWFWTKSDDNDNDVRAVYQIGNKDY